MQLQSIGTGNFTNEGELILRPNAAAIEEKAQLPLNNGEVTMRLESSVVGGGSDTAGCGSGRDEKSITGYEEPIVLTQSTHSFLFTESICSVPFVFALGIVAISYTCLILTLYNNIYVDSSPGNPLNVPVNVSMDVRIAQYLALLIGLVMEDEIPESLYLLRMISKKTLRDVSPSLDYRKFVFCACVRIVIGCLFCLNMFVVVAQATTVLEIFFDVLALQFIQQFDDIAFRLAKWDVFGKRLKRASTKRCFRAEFEKIPYVLRKKMTNCVKVMYIINFCSLMAGMYSVAIKQNRMDYHCRSITVTFDDHIWENALVVDSTGKEEEINLIYSYFNGVYVLSETRYDERPVYIEQNKFDDSPYEEKVGAVIKYCKAENAWIFMHDKIRKGRNIKDSSCPWLLRSPVTESYDVMEVDSTWSIWTGIITTGATFQTTCNGCNSEADCNYHGTCADGECICDLDEEGGYGLYYGMHCEFSRPCPQLIGDAGGIWNVELVDSRTLWRAYGRGVYTGIYREAMSALDRMTRLG